MYYRGCGVYRAYRVEGFGFIRLIRVYCSLCGFIMGLIGFRAEPHVWGPPIGS